MISLSGKHLVTNQRAYALLIPEIPGESPAQVKFGFAPTLADFVLSLHGYWEQEPDQDERDSINTAYSAMREIPPHINVRTPQKIQETIAALLSNPQAVWGYRLVEAQWKVVAEAAWLLDLDDLLVYYEGPATENEEIIRDWIEHNVRDLGIQHIFLDAMVQYDRDLDAPGLLDQIHRQLDEGG